MFWNLGAGRFDSGAGLLFITSNAPSASLSKPEALQWSIDTNTVTVFTNGPVLSELRAPLVQVNVYVTNDYKYALHFAAKVGGQFQTNAPFVTFAIENPNGSTNANTLRITENRGGHVIVSEFTCLTNNSTNTTWQLVSGNGLRGVRLSNITNSTAGTFTKTYEYFNPSNSVVLYREQQLWKTFYGSDMLLSATIDPGGLALTTTNTYDADGRLL